MDKHCIIIKIIIILALVLIFYKIYKQTRLEHEGFNEHEESNSKDNSITYLKLNETYIEPEGTSLDILYATYSGEELNKDVWEKKTLEQCTDLCNQLDGCTGFSRKSNVNDNTQSECYPRNRVVNCHSVRKGNTNQMQNAIKYNSFIKTNKSNDNSNANSNANDKKILNKCIGDPNMTLKRAIYIKSQMFPNKYIGTLGDGIAMLIDKNSPDFETQCKFRIEVGQDGIGTVSFFHIYSNKYLCRMKSNNSDNYEFIGLKDISKGRTEDKQCASYNILDSMKNLIKFRCLPIDGENIDKYIAINNDNNNYLVCSSADILPTEQLITFSIVDQIISSKIINDKSNLPANIDKEKFNDAQDIITDVIGNQIISKNTTANTIKLDTTKNTPLYNNLFATPTNVNITHYLNDNYGNQFNRLTTIDKKVNDIALQQQLSNSLTKNQDMFNSLQQLNQEIENEIKGLNMDLTAKNDKVVHDIDRMKITDMAKDYYALQNIYPYVMK